MAALFIFLFLGVALGVLLNLRRCAVKPPPVEDSVQTSIDSEAVAAAIEKVLLRTGWAFNYVGYLPDEGTPGYRIEGPFPGDDLAGAFKGELGRFGDEIQLEQRPEVGKFLILGNGEPLFALYFVPPPPSRERMDDRKPRIAIIIDDLGKDFGAAEDLLALDFPVTFSLLPGERHTRRIAAAVHRRGREVLVHIPMEPLGYPEKNPGDGALFVSLAPDEIRRRLRGYFDRVPNAVGGNNHMGSRFTESREKMEIVLQEMKGANLFFVDSVTSGGSVAFDEARDMGIPAASRDIFLDNVKDTGLILRQIRALAELAERQGSAVGIGHPYPETVEALRDAEKYLKGRGIDIVPVSRLLVR